ncbi:hypothetical protein PGT21_032192 [Puccinia graminis f. sp. tritici]|uniref:Uncharacterized protein n=1 Tax=Puccinia graminis f. sp. tritici TaxID=56615 RepID=A0A5B0M078_PUCGR|nr:hypothetical protein PGT21_032192 [Puccinia graminis f. sp. tritici]KAA1133353.1 hypothetical protein PGTUg99_027134 [Puccinia graminis f. sp. tritici]
MQFSKIFPIFMALLLPHVQAWGCKDNPTVAGFPWSACLKSTHDYQSVDLIDAPWRGAGGYDCTMDDKGHTIPTCCSKHEVCPILHDSLPTTPSIYTNYGLIVGGHAQNIIQGNPLAGLQAS